MADFSEVEVLSDDLGRMSIELDDAVMDEDPDEISGILAKITQKVKEIRESLAELPTASSIFAPPATPLDDDED